MQFVWRQAGLTVCQSRSIAAFIQFWLLFYVFGTWLCSLTSRLDESRPAGCFLVAGIAGSAIENTMLPFLASTLVSAVMNAAPTAAAGTGPGHFREKPRLVRSFFALVYQLVS